MKSRTSIFVGGTIVSLVAFSPPVQAQNAPSIAQLNALQQQVELLQRQLRELQGQIAPLEAQARAAAAGQAQSQATVQKTQEAVAPPAQSKTADKVTQTASAGGPKVIESETHRFGLSSADGRNTIQLTGRVHFDVGDYVNYEPASKGTTPQNLSSGVNARRARIGVLGKVDQDFGYGLIYDFGGSSDTLNSANTGAPTSGIEQAYIQYNGVKGLIVEGGYLDTPFTLDESNSSNDIPFLERASSQVLAAGIAAGDNRAAVGFRWYSDRVWAGAYLTGPTSGAAHAIGALGASAAQMGAFGRVSYQVLQNSTSMLHLGIDAAGLLTPPHAGGVRSVSLSERPELRVDPTSILATGAITTASDASIYGVEAAGGYRSLYLQAEYYQYKIDRDAKPRLSFDGAYAEASWAVTGERRQYVPTTGGFSGLKPSEPFEIDANGIRGLGAFELAMRYSYVDLNDKFISGKSAASTDGIAGGFQQVYTAGVNWYPNTNIRFMLDYLHGDIAKAAAATGSVALGTPIGAKFDALALRTQFAF
jgi:phosphate-selective porin OprO/OprP